MAATTLGILDGTDGDDSIWFNYVDPDGETAETVFSLSGYNNVTVAAGPGDDYLDLYDYPAIYYGGAGNDTIFVNRGVAHGGDDDDFLQVIEGYGDLYGDAGNDYLSVNNTGFAATVTMTGGADSDIFDLAGKSFSTTRAGTVEGIVKDFTIGEDYLSVHGHTLTQADFANGFSSVASGDETITVTQVGSGIELYWTDPHPVVDDGSYWGDARLTVENTNLEDYIASLAPDGIVSGTSGDDLIGLGFTDADGDIVHNDASIVDVINGGAGDDVIYTYAGNDIVDGGDGDDTIYGMKGANTLSGGAGNDEINSGRHTSELIGGDGDDALNALLNKGADHTLTGGAGADVFNMQAASLTKMSNVEITDFDINEDILMLDGVAVDFAALPDGVTIDQDADGNSVIHFADDDTVTLTGVSNNNLLGLIDPNGWVDGSKAADVINLDYVDESGEMVHDDASIVDEVHGKNGADLIKLYAGDDIAFGGAKDDEVYGMKGHNEIHGGTGDDYLHTGRNTSELFGDDGDDVLIAQLDKGADHTLEGGNGADVFEMSYASTSKTSEVQIADYEVGVDTLSIDGVIVTGGSIPADITVDANDAGDAVIHFLDDDTITLNGVTVDEFLAEEADPLDIMLPF